MNYKLDDYSIITYRGTEDNEMDPKGDVYWAYCMVWDCLGDGSTKAQAKESCKEGIVLKMGVFIRNGIDFPKP